jgi:hypothetical protein
MLEIARTGNGEHLLPGHSGKHPTHVGYEVPSPEGSEIYSQKERSVLTIFQLDNISNVSTGLRLWQAETDINGMSWTDPHPFIIPQLHAENVSTGMHIAPGNGIELQYGPYAGRLLTVLLGFAVNATTKQDVVVFSDNGGKSWHISETPLPGGEAQLAELRTSHHAPSKQTAIIFNSRTGNKRGVAWSYDYGVTFTDIRVADDLSGGTGCLASILTPPFWREVEKRNSSSLLYSHPSGKNRTHKGGRNAGVLLRSDDEAGSWYEVASATPEDTESMFGYSMLNSLAESETMKQVGLTYETGDKDCEDKATACKIIYRTFEL